MGIHDGIVDPAVTKLVNDTMHETATAFAAVRGEHEEQKLVRGTGKMMLNTLAAAKKRARAR